MGNTSSSQKISAQDKYSFPPPFQQTPYPLSPTALQQIPNILLRLPLHAQIL